MRACSFWTQTDCKHQDRSGTRPLLASGDFCSSKSDPLLTWKRVGSWKSLGHTCISPSTGPFVGGKSKASGMRFQDSEQDPEGRSRQRTSPCFGASEVASTQICEHKSAGSCGQWFFDLSAITRQTGANGEFWTFTGWLHAQAFALP